MTSDREERFYSLTAPQLRYIIGNINQSDLVDLRPGSIIRYDCTPPKLTYHESNEFLGCIAGWISDEDTVEES